MPRSSLTPQTGTPTTRFSISDIEGSYAFRFSGFTMLNNILYHLSGLGNFDIVANGRRRGRLTGRQRSSITPLQGQKASLEKATYDLSGTMTLGPDGTGDADVDFQETSGRKLDGYFRSKLKGYFYVLVAGSPDRLWLVSSGATVLSSGATVPPIPAGTPADELVNVEAIRIPQPNP